MWRAGIWFFVDLDVRPRGILQQFDSLSALPDDQTHLIVGYLYVLGHLLFASPPTAHAAKELLCGWLRLQNFVIVQRAR